MKKHHVFATGLFVTVLLPAIGCGPQQTDVNKASATRDMVAVEVERVEEQSPTPVLPPSEILPAERLSPADMVFVDLVLPLINNNFPFRNVLKTDPANPALRRAPTNQLVLRQVSGNGFQSQQNAEETEKRAAAFISSSIKLLGDGHLVKSYFAANRKSYSLPDSVFIQGLALNYDTVNRELAGKDPDAMKYGFNWWVALANAYPGASVIVQVSKPVISASGDKALMSATVESNQPDRFTTYYLFDKYQGQWVVANSATLR